MILCSMFGSIFIAVSLGLCSQERFGAYLFSVGVVLYFIAEIRYTQLKERIEKLEKRIGSK